MTKRQLIDEIVAINRTAPAAFLAKFEDGELNEYLEHLRYAQEPKASVRIGRHERFFQPAARPVTIQPGPAQDSPASGEGSGADDPEAMPLFESPPADTLAEPALAATVRHGHEVSERASTGTPAVVSQESEEESEAWLY